MGRAQRRHEEPQVQAGRARLGAIDEVRDCARLHRQADAEETAEKVREEHYPAPFRLIDLFEKHGGSFVEMKREETRAFAPLMISEQSQNLRRIFRLSEMLKAEAPKDGYRPMRAHVVGAGTMGADIAMVCAAEGMEVSLQDVSADAVNKALERRNPSSKSGSGRVSKPQRRKRG